jgi:ketosteroid isomerase-like protein
MMRNVCGLGWIALACWSAAAAAQTAEQPVEQVLEAYEQAWSRHDPHAIASFYLEPAMRVSKGGPVVRATRADEEAFFAGFLRGMVGRGYERSAWEHLEVRLLDRETALASGVTVRYRADGTLFERVAVTYALWRSADGWKIFLSATHAPDRALRFR